MSVEGSPSGADLGSTAVGAESICGPNIGPSSISSDIGTASVAVEGRDIGMQDTPLRALPGLENFEPFHPDPGELDFGGVRRSLDAFTMPNMVGDLGEPEVLDRPVTPIPITQNAPETPMHTLPINFPSVDVNPLVEQSSSDREDSTLARIGFEDLHDFSILASASDTSVLQSQKPDDMDFSLNVPLVTSPKVLTHIGELFIGNLHPVEPNLDVQVIPEPVAIEPIAAEPVSSDETFVLEPQFMDTLISLEIPHPEPLLDAEQSAIDVIRGELSEIAQQSSVDVEAQDLMEEPTDMQPKLALEPNIELTSLLQAVPETQPQNAAVESEVEQPQATIAPDAELLSEGEQATEPQPISAQTSLNQTASGITPEDSRPDFILALPEMEARKEVLIKGLELAIRDIRDKDPEVNPILGYKVIDRVADEDPGKSPVLPPSKEDPTWKNVLNAIAKRIFPLDIPEAQSAIEKDLKEHAPIALGQGTKATKEQVQEVFESPNAKTSNDIPLEGDVFIASTLPKNVTEFSPARRVKQLQETQVHATQIAQELPQAA